MNKLLGWIFKKEKARLLFLEGECERLTFAIKDAESDRDDERAKFKKMGAVLLKRLGMSQESLDALYVAHEAEPQAEKVTYLHFHPKIRSTGEKDSLSTITLSQDQEFSPITD